MLLSLNHRLRRNRRWAACVLTVLAFALAGLATHSAVMSAGAGMGHGMSAGTSICLTLGGCVAVIGVALLTGRRLRRRLALSLAAPLATVVRAFPATSAFLVRAGPPAPPALIQVFRL
jgi:hypothetical protein